MRFGRLQCVVAFVFSLAVSGISQSMPNVTNRTPLVFEPNQGRSSTGVSYVANHRSYRISINESSIAYAIPTADRDSGSIQTRILQLRWAGDARGARFHPEGLLPGKSNYFLGRDASRWFSNVPHYSQLKEIGAMPGVDVRYYSSANGELEYDLIVAAETDLAMVRLLVEGADEVHIDHDGAVCLKAGAAELRQLAPRVSEIRGNRKVTLEASYVLKSANEISFEVRGRTRGSRLIIDPVLQYATYIGGSKSPVVDEGMPFSAGLSTAVDPAGNFFISGQTFTLDFPVTKGAYLSTCPAGGIACVYTPMYFVTKFSRSGQLLYSTYLAGVYGVSRNQPTGKMLAVDQNGYAYVVGGAFGDFPTTPGAYQETCMPGGGCAILAKLNQMAQRSFIPPSSAVQPRPAIRGRSPTVSRLAGMATYM